MLHKVGEELVAECDHCGHEEHGETADSYGEFLKLLKQDGWTFHKEDDEWQHVCPQCA